MAANKALVATLNAHQAAVEQLLNADEPAEDAEASVNEALSILSAAGARLAQIDAEVTNLDAACVA
jgi:hypothetical protein